MSLDVYLEGAPPAVAGSGIFVRENGATREITRAEWDARFPGCEPMIAEIETPYFYQANITHNLSKMADDAGLYRCLWRPEEVGITTAAELIRPLTDGLAVLLREPEGFRAMNPSNGWGSYEGLVRFVEGYLDACKEHPTATARACR